MRAGGIQRFELNDFLLQYDCSGEVLLCKSRGEGKNLWIRKIEDGGLILDVIDSDDIVFIAFEFGEQGGQFLALEKKSGKTLWFIPGKAYMYRLFGEYLYLIFIDSEGNFYLVKSSRAEGGVIWHHVVGIDLSGYTIRKDYVTLVYSDGRKEIIDNNTGGEIC